MELTAAERADPTALARHLADCEALRNSIDLTGDAEDDALSDDAWREQQYIAEDVWREQWEMEMEFTFTYDYGEREANQIDAADGANEEETRIALARIDVANAIEWTEQAVEVEAVLNGIWAADEEEEARTMN